jgi:hypothetical protein
LLNERGNLLFEAPAVGAMDAARYFQHLHTAFKLSMCDLDGSEYSSHFRYSKTGMLCLCRYTVNTSSSACRNMIHGGGPGGTKTFRSEPPGSL